MVQSMMLDPSSNQLKERTDGANPPAAPNCSFKFEVMSSAAPIRFNPETLGRSPTTNLSPQSSPSSNMISETVMALTQPSIEATNDSMVTNASNLHTSTTMSAAETSTSDILGGILNQAAVGIPSAASQNESSIEAPSTPNTASAPYQASNDGKKLPGKLTTQYIMPDGTVITGKGLGRGRPGVKRGPRKLKMPGEDSTGSTPPATSNPSISSMTSMTPSGMKRKRADSDASNNPARSMTSSIYSRESSVEYNPTATQTRSGRQTQKPVLIMTPANTVSTNASPASKKVLTPAMTTPALKSHPKIKRKLYRGKEQFALCEHCLRGFGPSGNVIVFCDACNKCWHQRCHQPQIPKELVADSAAEWFCASCDKILHGGRKTKKPPPKSVIVATQPPPEQKFGPPLVGAIALTLDQRKKYLDTLSREQLTNLLLRAGELAPQMPIFETPIPLPRIGPHLQPQFTSDYVTPVTESPNFNKVASNDLPDEGYDDSYDEHAALYPKVGEGVELPPEREDLNMLLEGPDSRTFSHWVKGLPVKTVVDTIPLHPSQPQLAK